MSKPTSLQEEIKFVLDPNDKTLFETVDRCPCCNSPDLKDFFTKFGYKHSICRSCEFIFVNPTPKAEKLNELYEADFYTLIRENIEIPRALQGDAYASLSLTREDASDIIETVTDLNPSAKWLDVGGGIGSFLNLAKKRAPGMELYLLEYNSRSAEFARDEYKINVLNNVEEVASRKMKFDVISLIAVLEHVSTPREFVASLREHLNEGGLLVLTVPFCPPFMQKFKQEYTYFLPPYHLSLFNKTNIASMLKELGYHVTSIQECGPPAFTFQYLFHYSERQDSKIPFTRTDQLETFYSPSLTAIDKLILLCCRAANLLSYPVRKYLMPRSVMTVIATKS